MKKLMDVFEVFKRFFNAYDNMAIKAYSLRMNVMKEYPDDRYVEIKLYLQDLKDEEYYQELLESGENIFYSTDFEDNHNEDK